MACNKFHPSNAGDHVDLGYLNVNVNRTVFFWMTVNAICKNSNNNKVFVSKNMYPIIINKKRTEFKVRQ